MSCGNGEAKGAHQSGGQKDACDETTAGLQVHGILLFGGAKGKLARVNIVSWWD
jgi:hypothetical protein